MTKYITIEQVIKINREVITKFNTKEQIGVKDHSLLESAIYRPQQSVLGKEAYVTIWDKAAALFESLGKNHPFFNGNKRTALSALIIFLYINGFDFVMDEQDADDFTVDMINGEYSFKELSSIIQVHSRVN